MTTRTLTLWAAAAALGLSGIAGLVAAQTQEIIIMGGRSQSEFLGCLTCNEYAGDSVWNKYSQHGWENSYGTWSEYGEHGGRYGSNSACNEYSSNGPALVDRQGNYYGRLSVNEYATGSVCGATGAPQICRALKVMCAHD